MSTWNPKVANLVPFVFVAGILLEGSFKDWEGTYMLINCYGPYLNIQQLWGKIMHDGLLKLDNVMFGGDMKFTLSTREI